MKPVRWILVGTRIIALTGGLTVVGIGCGEDPTKPAGTSTLSQEEIKANEDTQKAMEAASKK